MSKVYIASDHAGFALKLALIPYIGSLGYEVEDMGPMTLNLGDDYPDYVIPCSRRVASEPGSFGIIIGASGQGEAMAANRTKGVHAAVYYAVPPHPQVDASSQELGMVESFRAHNNANILSLGARFLSLADAEEAVKLFLATPFSSDPRHARRLAKF